LTGRRRNLTLITIGVALFLIYLVLTNPFSAFSMVRFDPVLYTLAVAVDYFGLFLFVASWYIILRILGVEIGLIEATQVTFTSIFVGWIVPIPLNTEIARAYLIRGKRNSNMAKAVASVLVHRAYYNIAFGVIIASTALYILFLNHSPIPISLEVVTFLLLFAVVSSLVFSLVLSPRFLKTVYDRSPGWMKRSILPRLIGRENVGEGFIGFVGDLESVRSKLMSRPGVNLLAFVLVAIHWGLGAVTTYLVAISMGVKLEIWVAVFMYAVVEFIQQLNWVIPSGFGVVDAGLTGAFVLTGLPLSLASALSLLTRFATNWVELILFAPVAFGYGYRELLRARPRVPS